MSSDSPYRQDVIAAITEAWRIYGRVLVTGDIGSGRVAYLTAAAAALGLDEGQYLLFEASAATRPGDIFGRQIITVQGEQWVDGPLASALRGERPLLITDLDRLTGDLRKDVFAVLRTGALFSESASGRPTIMGHPGRVVAATALDTDADLSRIFPVETVIRL